MEQSSLDLQTQMQSILSQIEHMEGNNLSLKSKITDLETTKKDQADQIQEQAAELVRLKDTMQNKNE